MNSKKIAEAFGGINDGYLNEALEYKRGSQRGGITMSKKKIVSIVIAAALVIAVGATTIAAAGSGLFNMKQHFDDVQEKYYITDVPVIEDVENYAVEVDSTAKSGAMSAKVTSATCDGYSIYAIVDMTVDGFVMPDDFTEESWFTFRQRTTENHAINCAIEDVTYEGDTFTFVLHYAGMRKAPEEDIIIKLTDFGYYATGWTYDVEQGCDLFIPLNEGELNLVLPIDALNVQKGIQADSAADVRGAEIMIEISPLGMLLYGDRAAIDEASMVYDENLERMVNDKNYLGLPAFEFHMRDGKVIGDFFSYGELFGLLRSHCGWIDQDTGTVQYTYVGFSVPVDVSQIEYITVHDVPFYFSSAE